MPKIISKLSNKLMQLLLVIIACVIVIKITTFGWRPSESYQVELSHEKNLTARNLKKTVSHISENIGMRNFHYYMNLEDTAEYIIQSFSEMGYDVKLVPYKVDNLIFKNIVAQKPQNAKSDEILIIGAHYDSCFNPGADDNASAIAGIIELARLLKNDKLNRQIKFIAFVNEEPPFFQTRDMGSVVYAKLAKQQGDNITAAIILEMIGYYSEEPFSQRYFPPLGLFYPNRANFITIVSNFKSRHIAKEVYSSFKKSTKFPIEKLISPELIPAVNFSDHWSFWQENFAAIMITDTAYLRNKHYHQQTDLSDTLDYKKTADMLHGLKESIVQLAE